MRINYIDRLKGFAILLVVLGHVYEYVMHFSDSEVYTYIYSFHMPLFMFLSGFVALTPPVTISHGELCRKVLRRVVTYVFPALVPCWAIALFRVGIMHEDAASLTALWYGFHGLWYFKSLALFTLLLLPLARCKRFWQQMALAATVLLSLSVCFRCFPTLNRIFELEYSYAYFVFFMIGYWCRKFDLLCLLKQNTWLPGLAVVSFICLMETRFETHILDNANWRLLRPLSAIVAVTFLFQIRERSRSRVEQWLEYVGHHTLDIYLYHWLFVTTGVANLACIREWCIATHNSLLCLLAATILSIIIAGISILIGLAAKSSALCRWLVYGDFRRQ